MDLLADYRRATMFFETGDPNGAARLLEPIVDAEPGTRPFGNCWPGRTSSRPSSTGPRSTFGN